MDNKYVAKEMIPVEVLKKELLGCQFAVQCDMGNSHEYERIRAIKNILQWIESPSYQERLSSCGYDTQDKKEKLE